MDDNEVNVAPRLLSIISMGCSLGGAISSTILLAAFVGVNSIRLAWVHGGALFVLALSAPRGWLRWAIITLQSSLLAFVWNDRTRSAKIVITIILAIQATLYLFLPIGRLTWSRDTYYWNIFTPAMPLTPLLLPKTPPSTPGSSVAKAGTAHSTSPPSTEPANTISKRASDFSIV
ncbi:hypothetical protein B0H13DRAFT_720347 [Mycena leptocephala]|nr:hypothetical protein B0H13DRAFT_720347 [Mycena leptocephala]